ncbi:MAG: M20/M25/M40 family metallo-hydrolase [Phascolarctobacterium sp.]|uniref:M20/M25/M40 family metallo-hydrolase n=1 Tax=Phascolarctobacterium sp. TaxID=2049039 RepID=UPI0025FE8D41|nr:M20/M25/M40 family metallo-hydrolase [Phascolarctobacterium sp.]MCC8159394.1 M20/M25/M40 family metallo-hydrolase [Phascolarctobacterium sp.]
MINKDRLLNEFIELVRVPCPSKDEKAEAELLVRKLQAMGLEVKVDDAGSKIGGTTGNVWAFLPSNVQGATRLFFEAHMDSVPPTTGTKVVRRDGVLYSDGTTTLGGDDKVGIAAALEAVRTVQEQNIPHGDIQLCFTIAEEIGCLGVVNLDPADIKADLGYCLDIGGAPGIITNAAPRLFDIYFTVRGKSAHAGIEPEKGINAIMLAAKALAALPAYGRLDEETTLNVGQIEGGAATNIVAEQARFVIDMRCMDPEKLERLKDATISLIREVVEAGGGMLEVEPVEGSPAVHVAEDHAAVLLAKQAADNLQLPFELTKTGGCSDGNFLCGYGLPCILLATGMSKVHTTEEYLRECDLYDCARWVTEIIRVAGQQ